MVINSVIFAISMLALAFIVISGCSMR
jgi:hypothetical protein